MPPLIQPERLRQALDVGHAREGELEPAGVELPGGRQDGLLEPKLLGFLEAREHVSGRPDRPRQADLPEVDPLRRQRNIGN